jgi:hypothetical protein
VTEAKWLACTEPGLMLRALDGRLSNRKLRLFVSPVGVALPFS